MILRSFFVTVFLIVSSALVFAADEPDEQTQWCALVNRGAEQLNAGSAAEAEKTLRAALALLGDFSASDQQHLDTVEWLALANWHLRQFDEAERLYRSELELIADPSSPRLLVPLRQLGKLAMQQRNFTSAQAYYEQYVRLSEKLPEDDSRLVGCLAALARISFAQGGFEKAEQLFLRVITMKEQRFGSDHIELVLSLDNLAQVQLALGQKEGPGELLSRSLVIQEQTYGSDSPQLVRTLGLAADYLKSEARIGEAEALCHRIVAIEEAAGRQTSDEMIVALENLVDLFTVRHPIQYRFVLESIDKIFVDRTDWATFAEICVRLLDIKQQRFGGDDQRLLPQVNQLVWIGIAQGDYEMALEYQHRGVQLATAAYGPQAGEAATQTNNLGAVFYVAENYDEAYAQFMKAKEIYMANSATEPEGLQAVLNNCIQAAEKSGKKKQVEQLRRQVKQLLSG